MLLIVFPHFALLGTAPGVIFNALHFLFPGLHQLVIALAELLFLEGQSKRELSAVPGQGSSPKSFLTAGCAERESRRFQKRGLLGHRHAAGSGTNPRVNTQYNPLGALGLFSPSPTALVQGLPPSMAVPSHRPSAIFQHPKDRRNSSPATITGCCSSNRTRAVSTSHQVHRELRHTAACCYQSPECSRPAIRRDLLPGMLCSGSPPQAGVIGRKSFQMCAEPSCCRQGHNEIPRP